MRALLLLALLIPFAVFFAWYATASLRREIRNRRHIEEVLKENERLDQLLEDDLERHRRSRARR